MENFNFGPKLTILQSLWIVASFGDFGKVVIFRILGVVWSRFLHRTTLMWFSSRFSYVFENVNF